MAERYHMGVNRNDHPTMFICREPACEIKQHFYLAADYERLTGDYQFQKAKADRLDVLVDEARAATRRAHDKLKLCVTAGVLRHDINVFLAAEADLPTPSIKRDEHG